MCRIAQKSQLLLLLILSIVSGIACNPTGPGQMLRAKVTRIDVVYPGMTLELKRFGPPGEKEHDNGVIIKFGTDELPMKVSAIDDRFGELQLSNRVTINDVAAKIKKRIPPDSEFMQLEFGSTEYFFKNKLLVEARFPTTQLRIEKDGKSCDWPCSREELKRVLGPPTSETETEGYVGGP